MASKIVNTIQDTPKAHSVWPMWITSKHGKAVIAQNPDHALDLSGKTYLDDGSIYEEQEEDSDDTELDYGFQAAAGAEFANSLSLVGSSTPADKPKAKKPKQKPQETSPDSF